MIELVRRRVSPAVLVPLVIVVVLGVAYRLAPPMGTDLAAQVARADFWREFGARPIDFRWYGGVNQFGYSLTTPAVMAVIGPRTLGVVAAVAFTAAMAYVLVRTGARRPVLGGVAVALVAIANLVSGRITFGAGLAVGAGALAVAVGGRGTGRRVGALALAALTTVTSPVAGLFLGLAAGAWLLADLRVRGGARLGERWPEAVALGAGAALGLVPMVLFSDAGRQPFTASSMWWTVALTVAVAVVVPARPVRVGAALVVALLLFAYAVPTAIGSNALRLPMLFAIPVAVAYSGWRWWALAPALALMFWLQPPLLVGDIRHAGAPETTAGFYAPLLAELDTLGPLGRIEVVPLRDHWESVHVADAVPLARGWLRQVDTVRNPPFYPAGALTEAGYGDWLRDNAVSYVAVPLNQPLDLYGRSEAAVIGGRPDYLTPVWSDADWQLYRVAGAQPFVTGGVLVRAAPDRITVDVTDPRGATIRVRWSRWLTATGGACVSEAPGGWVTLIPPSVGRYSLTSGFGGTCRTPSATGR